MNRTILLSAGVVLSVIGLVVASTQTRRTAETPQTKATKVQPVEVERGVPTQQRVNRYFHSDVMPKLSNCWSGVKGKGSIELEHSYTKGANGRWVSAGVVVSKTTLPRGQDAAALRCMQSASKGTSFPAESTDGSTYVIRWNWPVPFPSNAAQLTTNMFAARLNNNGGGSGGCDGAGTLAKCYTCSKDGRDCEKVCVGYKECKITFPGRECTASASCASGGPFGFAGGGIIY